MYGGLGRFLHRRPPAFTQGVARAACADYGSAAALLGTRGSAACAQSWQATHQACPHLALSVFCRLRCSARAQFAATCPLRVGPRRRRYETPSQSSSSSSLPPSAGLCVHSRKELAVQHRVIQLNSEELARAFFVNSCFGDSTCCSTVAVDAYVTTASNMVRQHAHMCHAHRNSKPPD